MTEGETDGLTLGLAEGLIEGDGEGFTLADGAGCDEEDFPKLQVHHIPL